AELVKKRKQDDIAYKKYLEEIVALAKKVKNPMDESVSADINTKGLRALYDNLGQDVKLALSVDEAIINSREADWRGHFQKEKGIENAIRVVMPDIKDEELKNIFEI